MNGSSLTDFFRPSAACLLSDKIERAVETTKDIPSPAAVRRMLAGCYPVNAKPLTNRDIEVIKRSQGDRQYRRLTDGDRAKIVALHGSGKRTEEIARIVGRHPSTVCEVLTAHGIDRKQRVGINKRDRVVSMLNEGTHSRSAIAEAVGCSHYYVRSIACKLGMKLGPSPMRKDSA